MPVYVFLIIGSNAYKNTANTTVLGASISIANIAIAGTVWIIFAIVIIGHDNFVYLEIKIPIGYKRITRHK